MNKVLIILLLVVLTINLHSEEYNDVKGIEWSEAYSEIIVKKDENIKEKTEKAYETAKLKAVKKNNPIEIEGNGIKSNIVQNYIFERAKLNIIKEFPAEWEREKREDGTTLFKVKLKIGLKEKKIAVNSGVFLKIENNKKSYQQGEKIKFKIYCSENGYVSLFILYNDGRVSMINLGNSNPKGVIKSTKDSDELGEWGITEAVVPLGSGNEQVIYAVYTKEYWDIRDKVTTVKELAKEINEVKEIAESAVMYSVIP
jgi:hypothetical protein